MARVGQARIKTVKSKSENRDVLTEMFERFGIKVIDVSNSGPKIKYRKGDGAL